MGINPGRPLQTEEWDEKPMGCSYEAGGDGAFHFNTRDESDWEMEEDEVTPGRFQDGEFKMICRQGK